LILQIISSLELMVMTGIQRALESRAWIPIESRII
jgi:hypothetical protein